MSEAVAQQRKWASYLAYKPSDVAWLGEVPEHWRLKPLKRVFVTLNGSTPRSGNPDYWDGDIPWATPDDLGSLNGDTLKVTRRMMTQEGYASCGVSLASEGSLVLSTRAPIGHLAIAGVRLCTNQGCRSLVFRGDDSRRFFFYQLLAARPELQSLGQGSTFTELSRDRLTSAYVVSPPADEQKAIAAFLDRETARIDALIDKKQRQIELLQEKRSALINHAVTKGLDPDAPMKDSGIEWLEQIPEHWGVKKMRWLFSYSKGRNAATLTKEYVGGNPGDYPVYSGQTENDGLMGLFNSYEFSFDSPVIFVTTVGAKAMTTRLVQGQFSLSQNCALIIPRSSTTNPIYFEGAIRRLFDFERRSISLIMQPSLRFEDLDRFRIPLPPAKEQDEIASLLTRETSQIDTMVAMVEGNISPTCNEHVQKNR